MTPKMTPPKDKQLLVAEARIRKLEAEREILIAAMHKIIKNPLNGDYYAQKALKEIGE